MSSTRRIQALLRHCDAPKDSGVENCSFETETLAKEREKATFEVRDLTNFLDGSEEYTQYKEAVAFRIESDEILKDSMRQDLSRPQIRDLTMKKIKHSIEMWQEARSSDARGAVTNVQYGARSKSVSDAFWEVMSLYDPNWATRLGVHFGLFGPAIVSQGTDAQRAKYESAITNMTIFGCFAMTELGHGSNVSGLETTATYNKEKDGFFIHSPTITSTKWWIGGAAHSASHSVVFAQLIIDKKSYGVHSFIVQLRSQEDGTTLPGITIGDCGAKMGRNGVDNGWIQFNQVFIKRDGMLSRWSSVDKDGNYHNPPVRQVTYNALIGGRVGMAKDASDWVKKALTIAVRYSAVRRQGTLEGGHEQVILNYQTHQYRLMPLIAGVFAIHCAADNLKEKYEVFQAEFSSDNMSKMGGMHASSAGLKAFTTWWALDAIEKCRQCMGGQGYSAYTGLSDLFSDFAVMCTWEGDNTVLAQQTARFLVKVVRQARKGKTILAPDAFERYLVENLEEKQEGKLSDSTDFLLPESYLALHQFVARKTVQEVERRLKQEQSSAKSSHLPKSAAWNECMFELVECSKAHCFFVMVQNCVERAKKAPETLQPVLFRLSALFALHSIVPFYATLLKFGYISSVQVDTINTHIRKLCKEIREEAVPIVDSFNIPDSLVNSPFGEFDGDIYNRCLETVKMAPNCFGVPPYYYSNIKPLFTQIVA